MLAASLVTQIVTLACLALGVWALVDVAARSAATFPAVDRQTKPFWLLILGIGALVLFFFTVFSFFGIAAVAASIVYLVDVRPKVAEISRGSRW